eukprot:TRINITY_DN892_c1_g1_i1.p1 TRINITY_DN892_c1_g1~~TRINITY_DN892_c1_g1_i1.p1  ORF type:complete len:1000 (-),score=298.14 TRINITY_DN892_c1_g1_i1:179-3178(-)
MTLNELKKEASERQVEKIDAILNYLQEGKFAISDHKGCKCKDVSGRNIKCKGFCGSSFHRRCLKPNQFIDKRNMCHECAGIRSRLRGSIKRSAKNGKIAGNIYVFTDWYVLIRPKGIKVKGNDIIERDNGRKDDWSSSAVRKRMTQGIFSTSRSYFILAGRNAYPADEERLFTSLELDSDSVKLFKEKYELFNEEQKQLIEDATNAMKKFTCGLPEDFNEVFKLCKRAKEFVDKVISGDIEFDEKSTTKESTESTKTTTTTTTSTKQQKSNKQNDSSNEEMPEEEENNIENNADDNIHTDNNNNIESEPKRKRPRRKKRVLDPLPSSEDEATPIALRPKISLSKSVNGTLKSTQIPLRTPNIQKSISISHQPTASMTKERTTSAPSGTKPLQAPASASSSRARRLFFDDKEYHIDWSSKLNTPSLLNAVRSRSNSITNMVSTPKTQTRRNTTNENDDDFIIPETPGIIHPKSSSTSSTRSWLIYAAMTPIQKQNSFDNNLESSLDKPPPNRNKKPIPSSLSSTSQELWLKQGRPSLSQPARPSRLAQIQASKPKHFAVEECKHKCKDKRTCSHACCKRHLTTEPFSSNVTKNKTHKKPISSSSLVNTIKSSYITPVGPSRKRKRRMSINIDEESSSDEGESSSDEDSSIRSSIQEEWDAKSRALLRKAVTNPKNKLDWYIIGHHVGRSPEDCQAEWNKALHSAKKKPQKKRSKSQKMPLASVFQNEPEIEKSDDGENKDNSKKGMLKRAGKGTGRIITQDRVLHKHFNQRSKAQSIFENEEIVRQLGVGGDSELSDSDNLSGTDKGEEKDMEGIITSSKIHEKRDKIKTGSFIDGIEPIKSDSENDSTSDDYDDDDEEEDMFDITPLRPKHTPKPIRSSVDLSENSSPLFNNFKNENFEENACARDQYQAKLVKTINTKPRKTKDTNPGLTLNLPKISNERMKATKEFQRVLEKAKANKVLNNSCNNDDDEIEEEEEIVYDDFNEDTSEVDEDETELYV